MPFDPVNRSFRFRRVGPRSSVWAERSVVAKAAKEFAEIEQMLTAAEHLCGPYVWKVYDVLVLPPSFPYGGMENPCLTFVSPTLLVSYLGNARPKLDGLDVHTE